MPTRTIAYLRVADVFEVWRYIHEQHPIDTDLGFMQSHARAVEKALAAMT